MLYIDTKRLKNASDVNTNAWRALPTPYRDAHACTGVHSHGMPGALHIIQNTCEVLRIVG
jgi:hypothetical protein